MIYKNKKTQTMMSMSSVCKQNNHLYMRFKTQNIDIRIAVAPINTYSLTTFQFLLISPSMIENFCRKKLKYS